MVKTGKKIDEDNMFNFTRIKERQCIENAKHFIDAAMLLVEKKAMYNIAYHLGVLAIEELGKASLVKFIFLAERRHEEIAWPFKHADDHEKKIFWALFGLVFSYQKITNKIYEDFKNLSRNIHETRLKGLYVDIVEERSVEPKGVITEEETKSIIEIASSLYKIKSESMLDVPSEEMEKDLNWLFSAADHEGKSRFIFSNTSMDMLANLHSVRSWIKWLREKNELMEKQANEALIKELEKTNADRKKGEKKWNIRVRLISDSHIIRNAPLKKWNENTEWIKLYTVNKKRELNVELVLLDDVPLELLWYRGYELIKTFVIAINIGALGCFWWYLPSYPNKYFEKIQDYNSKCEVEIKAAKNNIDWPSINLNEKMLNNTMRVIIKILKSSEKQQKEPFEHYFVGLSCLSKSDFFMNLMPNAFYAFYNSLKAALSVFEKIPQEELIRNIIDIIKKYLPQVIDLDRYIQLFQNAETGKIELHKITPNDVTVMKLSCDIYYNEYSKRSPNKC